MVADAIAAAVESTKIIQYVSVLASWHTQQYTNRGSPLPEMNCQFKLVCEASRPSGRIQIQLGCLSCS